MIYCRTTLIRKLVIRICLVLR